MHIHTASVRQVCRLLLGVSCAKRTGTERYNGTEYRDRRRRTSKQEGGREKRDRHDLQAGYEGQRPPFR